VQWITFFFSSDPEPKNLFPPLLKINSVYNDLILTPLQNKAQFFKFENQEGGVIAKKHLQIRRSPDPGLRCKNPTLHCTSTSTMVAKKILCTG